MNYSIYLWNFRIYLWNFRIVILNLYFIFNLIFNIYCKGQLNIFIETARYKCKLLLLLLYSSLSKDLERVKQHFCDNSVCWQT